MKTVTKIISLKSNMDRFIARLNTKARLRQARLKSNMDRFIVFPTG